MCRSRSLESPPFTLDASRQLPYTRGPSGTMDRSRARDVFREDATLLTFVANVL